MFMREVYKPFAANSTALQKLEQIQEQMRDMCAPQYHEYYRVTTERGFTRITIPKAKAQTVG
jgi:hypothetical protein